jgi:hypothetical protein
MFVWCSARVSVLPFCTLFSLCYMCMYTSGAGSITAVTADGVLFAHPLHHLGKSKNDLPLVAIDSFRHMYVLPNFEDIK